MVVGFVSVVGLSSCAGGEQASPPPPLPTPELTEPDVATGDLEQFFAWLYEEVEWFDLTPAEVSEMSTLVVKGRIAGFVDAREWGGSNPTVAMTVVVDEVHKGALPEGSVGVVYVEFHASWCYQADAFNEDTPRGLETVLYLIPGRPEAGTDPDDPWSRYRRTEITEVPEDQPLWEVPHYFGFVTEFYDDQIVPAAHVQHTRPNPGDRCGPSRRRAARSRRVPH